MVETISSCEQKREEYLKIINSTTNEEEKKVYTSLLYVIEDRIKTLKKS